jgi:hypothetical protein
MKNSVLGLVLVGALTSVAAAADVPTQWRFHYYVLAAPRINPAAVGYKEFVDYGAAVAEARLVQSSPDLLFVEFRRQAFAIRRGTTLINTTNDMHASR